MNNYPKDKSKDNQQVPKSPNAPVKDKKSF